MKIAANDRQALQCKYLTLKCCSQASSAQISPAQGTSRPKEVFSSKNSRLSCSCGCKSLDSYCPLRILVNFSDFPLNPHEVAFTFFHDHDWKSIELNFLKNRKSRHGQLWKSEQVWTWVAPPRSYAPADKSPEYLRIFMSLKKSLAIGKHNFRAGISQ